jgi:hypothetical protein
MMNNKPLVRFSHNWNDKLYLTIFSTFRKYDEQNLSFYSKHLGDVFDVFLKKQKMCEATLIGMKSSLLKDVPVEFLWLDTGYNDEETIYALFEIFGIGREDKVLWLFFKRV